MSRRSNDQGRAFEFITLITLEEQISQKMNEVVVEYNSSYTAAKSSWENIDDNIRLNLKLAAEVGVESILNLEPMILDENKGKITLLIQPDSHGEEGDVRDILLVRKDFPWEIGLSLKHNHFAVKHSRLAKNLDFGEKWFEIPCSNQYWKEIEPIFNYLEEKKKINEKWRNLPDKENDVYIPLLNAFKGELIRTYDSNPNVPRKMVEYLLGKYDFYKIISEDAKKRTQILTFNSNGTLNQSNHKNSKDLVPILKLPTEIIDIKFKPNSKTTLILNMNEGWKFSFRIHNASTKVEPSLKFDIKIIENPKTINSIIKEWNSSQI